MNTKLLSIQIKEKEEKGSREGENHILQKLSHYSYTP